MAEAYLSATFGPNISKLGRNVQHHKEWVKIKAFSQYITFITYLCIENITTF